MPNIIHWFGTFLLFAATALLIVASVSSPIWDNVGFLKGYINGRDATFGNWGYCVGGTCSGSHFGYDRNFLNNLGANTNVGGTISHALSKTLILTPICAGLSFIAFLFALSTHTVVGIFTSVLSFLALIATLVSLGLDLGFFILARNRINDRIPNSHMHLASCIWLVVAAAGCQLIAAFTVCFTRNRKARRTRDDAEFAAVAPPMRSTAVVEDPAYTGRPSTVGSSGPLVHDAAAPGTATTYQPTDAAYEPAAGTTTSGKTGHLWNRSKTTTTY
ncbi:hypothetical protein JCM8097_001436 [Rhodosporidiobolus ruineniae]